MRLGKLRKLTEHFSDDAEVSVIDDEQNYDFDIKEVREVFYNDKEYVELVIDIDF